MKIQTTMIAALLAVSISYCFGQKMTSEKRLDSLFTTLADQNQFSGSVLIAEKGKVIYKAGKGYSNVLSQEINNPETIFELASCSKQFTGVGIALLHREKKLNYTDDITVYIPELTSFKGVTIYDLLHHTSGVPEFLNGFARNWKNDRIATNKDVIAYYAERKDTLEFVPHSQHDYCNTNYVLLAEIIERVSKQKLDTYLAEKIFRPLKMDHTFIYSRREAPRKLKNYAFGYGWIPGSFEKATQDDPRVGQKMVYYMDGVYGAAKVNSTVEDLYKWMNAIKKNKILSKEEFEEVMVISKTSLGKEVSYGFGFEVRKHKESISYGHTGSWDGYISLMHYNSAKDRTIIIVNNFYNGTCPYNTIEEILDNKPSSNEYVKKVELKEEEIRQFVGEYIDPKDSTQIHIISYLEGHLVYNTDKLKWDMRFFPSSANTFQAIRQGGTDGVMKFILQSDGTMGLEMSQYGRAIGTGIRKN